MSELSESAMNLSKVLAQIIREILDEEGVSEGFAILIDADECAGVAVSRIPPDRLEGLLRTAIENIPRRDPVAPPSSEILS